MTASDTISEITQYLQQQLGLSVQGSTTGQPINKSAIEALERGDPKEATARLKIYLEIKSECLAAYRQIDPPELTAKTEQEIENLRQWIGEL